MRRQDVGVWSQLGDDNFDEAFESIRVGEYACLNLVLIDQNKWKAQDDRASSAN
jgi:hypothetical protein